MDPHRHCHLVTYAEDRVQGHHRILKDHRDLAAAHLAQVLRGQLPEIHAVNQHSACRHLSRCVDQTKDRETGDALSRPTFAHKTHDPARLHGEADIVDSCDMTCAGLEPRGQSLDVQCCGHLLFLGSITVLT